jgi:hypothetical protein
VLADAHRAGRRIELIIVENVETKIERNRREQELIKLRGASMAVPAIRFETDPLSWPSV